MKALLSFILSILLAGYAMAQSSSSQQVKESLVQAKNVMFPDREVSAQKQAQSWAAETQNNAQDANAWLNYALWTQRNTSLNPTKKLAQLKQISAAAKEYISSSGEMDIIRFLESNKTDSAAIASAMTKTLDRGIVYPFAIQNAIIRQNKKDLRLYCNLYQAWSVLPAQSPFYRYHANVLQSAPDSAVIAAMGENDLVPMAMLQQVMNIRPDVRLVYYTSTTAQQYRNVYLCLSLGENVLQQYKNASFHGLLLNISGKNEAGTPENILPAGVDLDYLQTGSFNTQVAQLNNNYLPSLLLAYRYYKKNNSGEAGRYKQLITKIAGEGGRTNIILPLLDKE